MQQKWRTLQAAVADANTEASEKKAVRDVLRKEGYRKQASKINHKIGRKTVRVYLWRDTPIGTIALATGPSIKGEVFYMVPAQVMIEQTAGETELYLPPAGGRPALAAVPVPRRSRRSHESDSQSITKAMRGNPVKGPQAKDIAPPTAFPPQADPMMFPDIWREVTGEQFSGYGESANIAAQIFRSYLKAFGMNKYVKIKASESSLSNHNFQRVQKKGTYENVPIPDIDLKRLATLVPGKVQISYNFNGSVSHFYLNDFSWKEGDTASKIDHDPGADYSYKGAGGWQIPAAYVSFVAALTASAAQANGYPLSVEGKTYLNVSKSLKKAPKKTTAKKATSTASKTPTASASDADTIVGWNTDYSPGLTVYGDTFPYKEAIKALGFRWSGKYGKYSFPANTWYFPYSDKGSNIQNTLVGYQDKKLAIEVAVDVFNALQAAGASVVAAGWTNPTVAQASTPQASEPATEDMAGAIWVVVTDAETGTGMAYFLDTTSTMGEGFVMASFSGFTLDTSLYAWDSGYADTLNALEAGTMQGAQFIGTADNLNEASFAIQTYLTAMEPTPAAVPSPVQVAPTVAAPVSAGVPSVLPPQPNINSWEEWDAHAENNKGAIYFHGDVVYYSNENGVVVLLDGDPFNPTEDTEYLWMREPKVVLLREKAPTLAEDPEALLGFAADIVGSLTDASGAITVPTTAPTAASESLEVGDLVTALDMIRPGEWVGGRMVWQGDTQDYLAGKIEDGSWEVYSKTPEGWEDSIESDSDFTSFAMKVPHPIYFVGDRGDTFGQAKSNLTIILASSAPKKNFVIGDELTLDEALDALPPNVYFGGRIQGGDLKQDYYAKRYGSGMYGLWTLVGNTWEDALESREDIAAFINALATYSIYFLGFDEEQAKKILFQKINEAATVVPVDDTDTGTSEATQLRAQMAAQEPDTFVGLDPNPCPLPVDPLSLQTTVWDAVGGHNALAARLNNQPIGAQLGSTPGGTMTDPLTGLQFYVKFPKKAEHAYSEVFALALYGAFMVYTPQARVATMSAGGNSGAAVISPLLSGYSSAWVMAGKPASGTGFTDFELDALATHAPIDALLANNDAIGAGVNTPYDNTLVNRDESLQSGKRLLKVEAGGALEWKGTGKKKSASEGWSGTGSMNLQNMLDPSVNKTTAAAFIKAKEDPTLMESMAVIADMKLKDPNFIAQAKEAAVWAGFSPQKAASLVKKLSKRAASILEYVQTASGTTAFVQSSVAPKQSLSWSDVTSTVPMGSLLQSGNGDFYLLVVRLPNKQVALAYWPHGGGFPAEGTGDWSDAIWWSEYEWDEMAATEGDWTLNHLGNVPHPTESIAEYTQPIPTTLLGQNLETISSTAAPAAAPAAPTPAPATAPTVYDSATENAALGETTAAVLAEMAKEPSLTKVAFYGAGGQAIPVVPTDDLSQIPVGSVLVLAVNAPNTAPSVAVALGNGKWFVARVDGGGIEVEETTLITVLNSQVWAVSTGTVHIVGMVKFPASAGKLQKGAVLFQIAQSAPEGVTKIDYHLQLASHVRVDVLKSVSAYSYIVTPCPVALNPISMVDYKKGTILLGYKRAPQSVEDESSYKRIVLWKVSDNKWWELNLDDPAATKVAKTFSTATATVWESRFYQLYLVRTGLGKSVNFSTVQKYASYSATGVGKPIAPYGGGVTLLSPLSARGLNGSLTQPRYLTTGHPYTLKDGGCWVVDRLSTAAKAAVGDKQHNFGAYVRALWDKGLLTYGIVKNGEVVSTFSGAYSSDNPVELDLYMDDFDVFWTGPALTFPPDLTKSESRKLAWKGNLWRYAAMLQTAVHKAYVNITTDLSDDASVAPAPTPAPAPAPAAPAVSSPAVGSVINNSAAAQMLPMGVKFTDKDGDKWEVVDHLGTKSAKTGSLILKLDGTHYAPDLWYFPWTITEVPSAAPAPAPAVIATPIGSTITNIAEAMNLPVGAKVKDKDGGMWGVTEINGAKAAIGLMDGGGSTGIVRKLDGTEDKSMYFPWTVEALPPSVMSVGFTIDSVEAAEMLPVGTKFIDKDDDPWTIKLIQGTIKAASTVDETVLRVFDGTVYSMWYFPWTITSLPPAAVTPAPAPVTTPAAAPAPAPVAAGSLPADAPPVPLTVSLKPVWTEDVDTVAMRLTKVAEKPGGGNPGGIYQDTQTGKKYLVKHMAPEAVIVEVLTAALYRAGGICAPDVRYASVANKGFSTISPWEEGIKKLTQPLTSEQKYYIREGMPFDMWLSNWDVAGMFMDNIVEVPGYAANSPCSVMRIDVGGSLFKRATGGDKAKGTNKYNEKKVAETKTFFSVQNLEAKNLFTKWADVDASNWTDSTAVRNGILRISALAASGAITKIVDWSIPSAMSAPLPRVEKQKTVLMDRAVDIEKQYMDIAISSPSGLMDFGAEVNALMDKDAPTPAAPTPAPTPVDPTPVSAPVAVPQPMTNDLPMPGSVWAFNRNYWVVWQETTSSTPVFVKVSSNGSYSTTALNLSDAPSDAKKLFARPAGTSDIYIWPKGALKSALASSQAPSKMQSTFKVGMFGIGQEVNPAVFNEAPPGTMIQALNSPVSYVRQGTGAWMSVSGEILTRDEISAAYQSQDPNKTYRITGIGGVTITDLDPNAVVTSTAALLASIAQQ